MCTDERVAYILDNCAKHPNDFIAIIIFRSLTCGLFMVAKQQ